MSFVRVYMTVMRSAAVNHSVSIVLVLTLLSVLSVHRTGPGMKCLQNNIQSLNTSLPLLRYVLQKHQIDVVLLQEVWHPAESINIRNFAPPIMKLRQGSEGGGVSIITHQNVKSVHLHEYDMVGLEAVWADVMVNGLRAVVGSVYIAPGDIKALDILESVVDMILCKHSRIFIAMDANSRSSLWDDSCLGMSHSTVSFRMGSRLEDIISKYGFQVHNDGTPTYRSGTVATAPDVTLTKGFCDYGRVSWSVTDDELCTPHECIVINVGTRVPSSRIEVIDWPRFNWKEYFDCTDNALSTLYGNWTVRSSEDVDGLVQELTACLQGVLLKAVRSRPDTVRMPPGAVRTPSGSVESGVSARPARNLRCGATFCNLLSYKFLHNVK